MTKLFTILLLVFALQVSAQNYPVRINITFPTSPDANTANWGNSASLLIITATSSGINGRIEPSVESSRILVMIKKGGSKICGTYLSNTAPVASFAGLTKVWSGTAAVSLLGQNCILPDGDYELSVQFFGNGAIKSPLSEEKIKSFTIRSPQQKIYQAPQLIAPANSFEFNEPTIIRPITFRWLPVMPVFNEPLTYRLKVWQRTDGQSHTQARALNSPIFTKDITNLTQTIVSNLIAGPCKPPYLCDFSWNVQALNKEGQPIGENKGFSEPFTFTVKGETVRECLPPPPGMVGWWSGDNNTADLSGLNNHGTAQGGLSYLPGKVSGSFPATNNLQYVNVPNSPSLNFGTGNFSADAWVKMNKETGSFIIVQKLTTSGGITNMTILGYSFLIKQGKLAFVMGQGSVFIAPDSQSKIDDNEWHFVAVTVDRRSKTGGKLYTDGQVVLTFDPTSISNTITNTAALTIGGYANNPITATYQNQVDELELFNRVLTPTEITALFNAGSAGKCKPKPNAEVKPGSICGMKFNDLNGNGIKDNNEPGIPGWEINLGGPVDLNVKTDERGNYCFSNLKPGEYILKEEIRKGWVQVVPTNGHFEIKLKEGQNITGRDFGNKVDPCATKVWKPLGEGANENVSALAVINGKLFAGGTFNTIGGIPAANRIAKWDGTIWSALGVGVGPGFVSSLATMGDNLFVGGLFNSAGGNPSIAHIAKWDENAAAWSALGTGVNNAVYALTIIGQQLYAKGTFTTAGGLPRNNIAQWNGTNWLPLGSGINNGLYYRALTSIGSTLYAGGSFTNAGGVSANNIAKWDGTNWSPLGSGVNNLVHALVEMGGSIYAGGQFTTAGGISANRIAKWDGTSWSPLGSGLDGRVNALAVIGSDLYVGGDFSTAGGITVNGIAKWDGTNWSALGTGVTSISGNNSQVFSLAVIGNELYVGGTFSKADGIPARNIAKYVCDVPPIVTSETSCNCTEKPWGAGQKVTSTDGIKPYIQETGCGGKLTSKVMASSSIKYNAMPYVCSTGDCKTTYEWKIVNAQGGAVISHGTALSLPVDFTAPNTVGDYRLIITPTCEGKPCRPCDFYFSVIAPVKNCITPPPGMVGWWSGDGTTSDLSGFNNHGVLLGGTSFIAGKVDKAFRTTKNTQTISIADNAALNFGNGSLSIDAWVKTKDVTNIMFIASKYLITGMANSFSSNGYIFFIQQGKLCFSMMQGTTSINQVVPNVQITDGNWHFVAVSVDRSSTTGGKIYVDGNVVLTFNPTAVPGSITNTAPLTIGGSPWNMGNPANPNFEYLVDEIELFNRALSESEMTAIFNAGADGKCKPIMPTTGNICGMKFHDLNGNGIKDSNEPGIPGWLISLGGPVDRSAKTDKNGNYCFNELTPGQYIIKEEQREGWQQTTPTTGHFEINVYGGQSNVGKDFGNKADSCRAGLKPKTWSPLGTGVNGQVLDIVVKGTDVYAGGNFTIAGGVPANHIAKWNGTSWSALGTGVNGQVSSLAIIGTDVYVGGSFTNAGGITVNNIAKWNGTGWSALGNGFNGGVNTLSVIGGQLYAGGLFTIAGSVGANNVAKWNGTTWTPLSSGTGGSSGGYQAVTASGVHGSSLYTGGLFLTAGGVTVNHVGKWNGTSWSSLGTGITTVAGMGIGEFASIGSDLYVAGYFNNAGGVSVSNIAKWNGTSWAALGSGVNWNIWGMAALGTDIYVSGNFTTAGGNSANHLARWDGASWAAVGTGTDGIMYSMKTNGHDLYVGGTFTTVDGVTATNIAKYSCDVDPSTACNCANKNWDALQNVTTTNGREPAITDLKCTGRLTTKVKTSSIIKYNTQAYNCATADCKATYEWKIVNTQNGATVSVGVVSAFPANFMAPSQVGDYQLIITPICGTKTCAPCGFYFSTVRGEFGSINGVKFNDLNGNGVRDTNDEGIADWEITLSGPIDRSVKTNSNGEYSFTGLIAGQYLIKEETLPGWRQTAPSSGNYNTTLQTGYDIFNKDFGNQLIPCSIKKWTALGTGVNGKVYAMARMGTDLYVGGSFTMAGGVPAKNIAKWNGTSWSALGSGVSGGISNSVRAITVVGTDVYVGGRFVTAGGVVTNNIAKWNGTNWAAIGTGVSANGTSSVMVEDIKVIDGEVYVGGLFATAGGVNANNIAKWNGSNWLALGSGYSGVVYTIAEMNGDIYVGGFTNIVYGDPPTNSFYKWNGVNWTYALNFSVLDAVSSLLVKGSNLYVGGFFNSLWHPRFFGKKNGQNFSGVGAGINEHVDGIVTIGTDIYIGGPFTTAGGVTAKGVAKWNGTNWSAVGTGIPGHIETLVVIGGDLYAGGDFTTAGGISAKYVAKYGCPIIINTDKKKK